MAKIIVFDTGPIISLTLNNLLWTLEPLHREFRGTFYIPMAVKKELVDRPLMTRKFKFEAMQIIPYISNGTLQVIENEQIISKAHELLDLANRTYRAKGNYIQIIQVGEMEAVAAALFFGADTIVVDERITRMLIEDPYEVRETLCKRLHTRVDVDQNNLKKFNDEVKKLKVIRSTELVAIAFELGILNKYMSTEQESFVKNVKQELLEGVLWGVKLNGCSVTEEEINDIIKMEMERHIN